MNEPHCQTQERLLDAAEELFATKGFDQVSIRELATLAKVNVAAVNYHFQGKENLFLQVVKRRFVHQRTEALQALEEVTEQSQGQPTLDDVIGTLVRSYLQGALGSVNQINFLSLIASEMAPDKPQVHHTFFKEMVAPVFKAFRQALASAHPGIEEEQQSWIIASIVGQIHHLVFRYKKGQVLGKDSEPFQTMVSMFPAVNLPVDEYIEAVTKHITRFSSAAILALYPEDKR